MFNGTIENLRAAGYTVNDNGDGTYTLIANSTGAVLNRFASERDLERLVEGIEFTRGIPEDVRRGERFKTRVFRETGNNPLIVT